MKPFRLSRRTVLRSAGIAIGLPVLDAMIDGRGRWLGVAEGAPAMAPPVRVMAFHFPHGVVLSQWVPTTQGKGYTITPGLSSLAAFQNDFNVISGLQQTAWLKGPGGGHANGMPDFATAVPSIATGAGGPSFEQVLAKEFGAATKFRALVAHNEQEGTLTEGATTAHMNNISWTAPGVFAPAERDPRAFFMTLVSAIPAGAAAGAPSTPSPQVIASMARKKSVLDHVMEDIGALNRRVGSVDKARLDEHLTSIQELERILSAAPATVGAGCAPPDPILGDPATYTDGFRGVGSAIAGTRAKIFLRLIATAFKCDLTRYASFALSNGFNDRYFPELGGGTVFHHQITHNGKYGPDPFIEPKIISFFASLLAYLLDQLKSSPEGAGTLLDNCLIYYGSEMAEGWHTNNNMPVVLAGRAGGQVVTGRHLAYADPTPLAKLFLAILKFGGSATTTFGMGGDAPLDGLTT
jgi:Protein of unknown function (DUF1552)